MLDHVYYRKVRSLPQLRKAWDKVFENGIKSKSNETRIQVKEFNKKAHQSIQRIYNHLKKEKFQFLTSKGIAIPRPGKKPRPIVISPLVNRIVQRRILDILQEESKIQEYIVLPTSFGGIKDIEEGRSVRQAVEMVYRSVMNNGKWFVRSDISDFFTRIPKEIVLSKIAEFIPDSKFNALLKNAITVELENLAILGANKELFPIHDIGVAQGCCLSPLIGNILLHDFDTDMNGRGIICIRYIDDFLIIGPSKKKAMSAFKNAVKFLAKLGLSAYDPLQNSSKADCGETRKQFEFLGCEILPGFIRPSRTSRKRLLDKIVELFGNSARLMLSPQELSRKKMTVIETLTDANNIIKGWGNQYSFCNDRALMEYLDKEIDVLLKQYFSKIRSARSLLKQDPIEMRRLTGIHLLVDSKPNPIIKS